MNWTDGPSMNHGKYAHGCATIPATEDQEAQIIVMGGTTYNHYPKGDNTTISLNLSSLKWSIIGETPLNRIHGHTTTNSNSPEYRVYSIGGLYYVPDEEDTFLTAIYGLNHSNKWELVGNLSQGRVYHTSLNIPLQDIPGCS